MRRDDIATVLMIAMVWILSLSIGYLYQTLVISSRSTSAQTSDAVSALPVQTGDNQPPRILGIDEVQPVVSTSASFKIATDEELSPADSDGYSLELIEEDSGQYTYLVKLDNLAPGQNRMAISLSDYTGNVNQHQLSIDRLAVPECWDGRPRTIASAVFPHAIDTVVDKYYKLDSSYYPADLVNGAYSGIPVYHGGSAYVRVPVVQPLKQMLSDARAAGISVYVSSGFRSYAAQGRAHNYWTGLVGGGAANYFAALPGHSEHHLGTTVDLLTSENGYTISEAYENTRLGRWLQENAHKYGFVMSYPKGKEAITGYKYEPWHWRYLGIDHASRIRELGITPTEYLYSINKLACN
ncbi:MAG: D-alanyl-D-alanine carboxypeptidase [candidate division WS6 bacterium OLB20]|uniref:D-alanyl-D-alanine carboxypeptidase n=1 Tax=candidate division WS6 bacterium OLB20 TaxID=1617426 RepID=A0A136LWF3_9BACT|nr:MAG: D-alanyl-D-alanine carboxypeptidase [candidate division WS6 bacterium OLB20]